MDKAFCKQRDEVGDREHMPCEFVFVSDHG